MLMQLGYVCRPPKKARANPVLKKVIKVTEHPRSGLSVWQKRGNTPKIDLHGAGLVAGPSDPTTSGAWLYARANNAIAREICMLRYRFYLIAARCASP